MYVCIRLNQSAVFCSFGVKMNNTFIILIHFTGQRCVCFLSSKCEILYIILHMPILFLGSYIFVTAPEEGHRARLMSEFIQSSEPR